jgi:transposase
VTRYQTVIICGGTVRGEGGLTVVWDRNQIHSRSKAVKAWLAKHPDVVCEDFPGYVPDLNPVEGVWGSTKYGRLAEEEVAPHAVVG